MAENKRTPGPSAARLAGPPLAWHWRRFKVRKESTNVKNIMCTGQPGDMWRLPRKGGEFQERPRQQENAQTMNSA